MHTVTGATSIAGLKKWAAQQPPQGADGAASAQYVAVASDACNIEFDFLEYSKQRLAQYHIDKCHLDSLEENQ